MTSRTASLVLHAADGAVLEAEWAEPATAPRGAVVLCHPHPQFGGTMRSIVISALFDTLPDLGYACLRFNFRGVERSTGEHGAGDTEPADVTAALDAAAAAAVGGILAIVGWSFGADMTLSVADPRISGWVAIAPPLRFGGDFDTVGQDPRPKQLVLAQHDEFRPPADVQQAVASWRNTTVSVVAGASHFFVGRTDRVVAATSEFLGALSA
jgi:alpha/beta superfamily hydrolase